MRNFVFNQVGDTTEIDIIGSIGEDWFGEGNTLQTVKAEVDEITTPNIQVNIDSLGGSVADGFAIHDLLKTHPANVTANIIGWTASAGTIIAMAADTVKISENSFFLIHNVWTGVVGNAEEMRQVASELDKFDDKLVNIYKKKTGKRENTIRNLMQKEEWLSAETAVELGFVDEITKPLKAAASFEDKELIKAGLPKAPERINQQLNTMDIKEQVNEILDTVKNLTESLASEKKVKIMDSEEVQAAIEGFTTKAEELQASISEKETENETLTNEVNELKETLEAKGTEVEELQNKVTDLESKLAGRGVGEAGAQASADPAVDPENKPKDEWSNFTEAYLNRPATKHKIK